jgi:PAS domain S-box-containing protein
MRVAQPLVQIGLLGEAIDGAPFAVFVADETGRYAAVNRHACLLTGYDRLELVAMKVQDVVVGDDVSAHFNQFVRDRAERGEVMLRRKDGETVPFRYRAGETTIAGLRYYVSVGVEA